VGFDGEISRLDASLLFGLFLLFLIYNVYLGKREAAGAETLVEEKKPLWQLFGLILLGIGCLVGGGQILVNGATDVARELGVSEKIIGMTILAAGTSLPELATSVVAARKGSDGLALGNVLGSNVFNAVFVLGACNLIAPMQITGVNMLDWSVLVGSCVLLWIVSFSGRRLTRGEGTLLLTAYVAYMTYTLLH
ncbi:MAG: sodium:calcium antiporter, partial [Bacteroidaceae bacterium]|nr:sodium:calcium antiporter [Bacteroidaceae bacterium]